MKNKHYYFLVVLLAFAVFVFAMAFAGCSTENPLCSTNFCAVGEVFPRSELGDNTAFSEVDIDDSVVFAMLVGNPPIPVETTPVETTPAAVSVTLADILADVAIGNETYLNQTVTVTGYVVYRDKKNRDAIEINTTNTLGLNTVFFIVDLGNPTTFNPYTLGQSYTFTVEIALITPPNEKKGFYSIFSRFPAESDN